MILRVTRGSLLHRLIVVDNVHVPLETHPFLNRIFTISTRIKAEVNLNSDFVRLLWYKVTLGSTHCVLPEVHGRYFGERVINLNGLA